MEDEDEGGRVMISLEEDVGQDDLVVEQAVLVAVSQVILVTFTLRNKRRQQALVKSVRRWY